MPELAKQIGVAVDLVGCPNRCRHCYLGNGPNGTLPREFLAEAAEAFWGWTRPGETGPYFGQVDVLAWYREPDFSDDYKELYDLSAALSRRAPRRYELLSIWRLARDESYAPWAKSVGPDTRPSPRPACRGSTSPPGHRRCRWPGRASRSPSGTRGRRRSCRRRRPRNP